MIEKEFAFLLGVIFIFFSITGAFREILEYKYYTNYAGKAIFIPIILIFLSGIYFLFSALGG